MRSGRAAIRNAFRVVPPSEKVRTIPLRFGQIVVVQRAGDGPAFFQLQKGIQLFGDGEAENSFSLADRAVDAYEEEAEGAAKAFLLNDPAGERTADIVKR